MSTSLRLYQGTLLHQLVHVMRSGQKIKSVLKRDGSSEKRYRTLLSAMHRVVSSSATRKEAAAPQPLDDLTLDLKQLFFQHQDEETDAEVRSSVRAQKDMDLDLLLSVRTRYRTRERNNRSRHPALARKEECRGWDLF